MKKMGAWTSAWAVGPIADGYEIEIVEFDFRDDGGVCYDKDGAKEGLSGAHHYDF
jgi:ribonuclease Z